MRTYLLHLHDSGRENDPYISDCDCIICFPDCCDDFEPCAYHGMLNDLERIRVRGKEPKLLTLKS